MAVLDHDQLLEQAELLIQPRRPGSPRQVDVRRAISAAYYAVFHFLMTKAADFVVGSTKRAEARYSVVYRSVDHAQLRSLCQMIKAQPYPQAATPASAIKFGEPVKLLAAVVQDLQGLRHTADYDPAKSLHTADAVFAIELARKAIQSWHLAPAEERAALLTLLLFKRR